MFIILSLQRIDVKEDFLNSRITEIQLYRNNELVMHFKGQWLKYSKDKEVKELYNSLIRKYLKA